MASVRRSSEVSRGSAERYADYLNADVDGRLIDLAFHLKSSSGPLSELDGSPESLVPLWGWFRRQIIDGLPGVRNPAWSSYATFFERERSPDEFKIEWACQGVTAYMLRVAQSVDASARWGLRGRDIGILRWGDDRDPGFVSDNYSYWFAESAVITFAYRTREAPWSTWDSQLLERLLAQWPESLESHSVQPFSPKWDDLLRTPRVLLSVPRAEWDANPALENARVSGKKSALLKREGLNPRLVKEMLDELAAISDSELKPAGNELEEPAGDLLRYLLPDRGILIVIKFVGKSATEVHFMPAGATSTIWEDFQGLLPDIARRTSSRLRRFNR